MAWPELAPELANYVQFNHGITFVLFFIFFLLAVIGVMNTMLMAVFERTRELGMLMALGMRPVQVIGLIMAEAAGLAVASLVVGGAAWRSGPLVFAGARSGFGWRYRRGDFSRRSGGGPPMVRAAGFSRLRHRLLSDWPLQLWCLRSILPGELLTFGRRKRFVRSNSDKRSSSGENQLAQSLAQSSRYPVDRPRLGFGSCVAPDFFGSSRWRPRANDCRRRAVWSGTCSRPGEGVSRIELRRTAASGPRWCLWSKQFLQTRTMKQIVRGVSPRLLATGLLSSSANSAGVRIMGVIPQDERAVSLIPQRMVEGTYLSK